MTLLRSATGDTSDVLGASANRAGALRFRAVTISGRPVDVRKTSRSPQENYDLSRLSAMTVERNFMVARIIHAKIGISDYTLPVLVTSASRKVIRYVGTPTLSPSHLSP
jgi:hypothetical protein